MALSPHALHPGPVTDFSRLLIGLVIVLVGGLYLFDAAGALDAGQVIHDGWPAVFVAAGVLTLLERPRGLFRGTLLVLGGTVGLLFTTGVLDDRAWEYVWPAAMIAAGVLVIWRFSGQLVTGSETSDDVVRTTVVFGGSEQASASRCFRGGWLTAVFGKAKLDLRTALPAPEGASVNATAAFGGVEVLVPHGWRVSIRSVPIFGGVDDKVDRSEPVPEDAPCLEIDAISIFGGVSVKHDG